MAQWRLGIDLGSNSLGWAAVMLDETGEPQDLIDWGVRIFSDGREPKTGVSLAVERRMARGMRRNRDRRQARIRACARVLHRYGLIPDMGISPYAARDRAAKEPVCATVLGRAVLHLCTRRGFLSNRKADGQDKEDTQRKSEMGTLKKYLTLHGLTLGQFLHQREQAGLSLRFRGAPAVTVLLDGEVRAAYPTRAMYVEEFEHIRATQGNVLLCDAQWDELARVLFFQRPLKVQQPGQCSFEDAPRASKHLPLAHTFRIVQEVNTLRYTLNNCAQDLTQAQKTQLYALLNTQKETKFTALRKALKLPSAAYFNLESEHRKALKGNETAVLMRSICSKHGYDWDTLNANEHDAVVRALLTSESQTAFAQANVEHKWGFSNELVEALEALLFSSSFSSLSEQAMHKLLPLMQDQGLQYWEAAVQIYGGHTAERFETGEVLEQLPYYGEYLPKSTTPIRQTPLSNADEVQFGRIPNPTVHVALNQLRCVVNALLKRFGNPVDIHIELARELKNNAKQRADIEKEIAKATKERKANEDLLRECGISAFSREDLLKIRLWKELAEAPASENSGGIARVDIFTGKTISLRQCVSADVEVEHILPFSRTYDDTMANKTITFREINREKGNRSPAEYLQAKGKEVYEKALQRAQTQLKASKRWRFQTDAMDIFLQAAQRNLSQEEKNTLFDGADGAFIARQLKDTQYMARIAARYLVPVVGTTHRVVPVNGRVTALLRNTWKLGFAKQKGTEHERDDHRHHAVDALLVALTSRSMIKRIAIHTAYKQEQNKDYRAKLYAPMPEWLGRVRDGELMEKYHNIKVSFKPDHSCEGKFFEETAYSLLPSTDPEYGFEKGQYNAVVRRAFAALKEKEVAQIRDIALRKALQALFVSPAYAGLKKWEDKRAKAQAEGIMLGNVRQYIRHVRILVRNQSIRRIPSAPYKGYAIVVMPFVMYGRCPKSIYKIPLLASLCTVPHMSIMWMPKRLKVTTKSCLLSISRILLPGTACVCIKTTWC